MRGRSSPRASRGLEPTRRPRKWRHWPRPPIGSDDWWDLVRRRLRVNRGDVEACLDPGEGADRSSIDPHDVRPPESLAARAVTYLALFPDVPTYASLMYVVHTWSRAGRSLKEWIVAQYATALDGADARLRDAAKYSLWVVHMAIPFDRAIHHRCTGTLDGTRFRIEGDRALARDAVGHEIELWPAGLFDQTA